jgi:hypothetical protein
MFEHAERRGSQRRKIVIRGGRAAHRASLRGSAPGRAGCCDGTLRRGKGTEGSQKSGRRRPRDPPPEPSLPRREAYSETGNLTITTPAAGSANDGTQAHARKEGAARGNQGFPRERTTGFPREASRPQAAKRWAGRRGSSEDDLPLQLYRAPDRGIGRGLNPTPDERRPAELEYDGSLWVETRPRPGGLPSGSRCVAAGEDARAPQPW